MACKDVEGVEVNENPVDELSCGTRGSYHGDGLQQSWTLCVGVFYRICCSASVGPLAG